MGGINLTDASEKLLELIDRTTPYRRKKATQLSAEQLEQIRFLNRMLLELAYPYCIAQHDNRDPGMQLTLTQGLVDQLDYKMSLELVQIVDGQWRVDHFWKPGADFLESFGGPLAFVGKQWNRHLDFVTKTNEFVCKDQWGIPFHEVQRGGVLANLRRAYIDKGNWPVINWFGLAYVSD